MCRPDPLLPPALTYHYETQCIPTPGAWFAHQLPVWFQKFSVVATYVIEIAVPVLFFAPVRRLRLFAFYCQVRGQSRDPCPAPAAVGLSWAGGQEPPSTAPPQHCLRSPQVLLQLLIILTGNYNFFNALTIVLAFSLLDEEHVGRWLGRTRRRHSSGEAPPHPAAWGWGPVCGVPMAGRGQVTVTDRPVWM